MELWALPEVVLRVFGGFPVLAVFCTVFALAFDLMKRRKKCGNYPPGPRALPFLGNLLQVDLHNPHLSFAKLRKQYGDVMSLDFGWTNVVVLSGYKALKEALVKKSEDFADRPDLPIYEKIFKRFGEGIVLAKYGPWWKAQRKFALLTLKKFGLGKKSLELRIVEEAGFLNQAFEGEQGSPFDPHIPLTYANSNIICSIIFGDRFEYHDERFLGFLHILEESFVLEGGFWGQGIETDLIRCYHPDETVQGSHGARRKRALPEPAACPLSWGYVRTPVVLEKDYTPSTGTLGDFRAHWALRGVECILNKDGDMMTNALPFIRHLPGPQQKIFENQNKITQFLQTIVTRHKESWDPDYPRDFIDAFFTQQEKTKHIPNTSFLESNLVGTLWSLFAAGTETTSTTLNWALLFMVLHPDVQSQVHEEIDRVIGNGRKPKLEDREEMPFTNAVIHETQRLGNIVPISLPHETYRDTEVMGYTIPKGTTIFPNITSALYDEAVWLTPCEFNPGHFLNSDRMFVKPEAFIPFSAGHRVCLGEQLAKTELFIFFTSLLQHFTFFLPENEPRPNFREAKYGITLCPPPYRLCAKTR